ncbi:MAG: hypothetical protein DHS20C16_37070 [Phycisphaerae bacterium]|nr:MAG: hypothetical protein DHS20C16_37070 [Phycisphaerae bacterium]
MQTRPLQLGCAIFTLSTLIAAGCNNPTSSLELTLTPLKDSFASDEMILISANLTASTGATCVYKRWPNFLKFDLVQLETNEAIERARIFVCGTPYVLRAPFIPLIHAGAFLDVADLGDRFLVINETNQYDSTLAINKTDRGFLVWYPVDPNEFWPVADSFSPGRYRLTVTLPGGAQRGHPVPLFWSVYGQPVTASTEFEVTDAKK